MDFDEEVDIVLVVFFDEAVGDGIFLFALVGLYVFMCLCFRNLCCFGLNGWKREREEMDKNRMVVVAQTLVCLVCVVVGWMG